VSGDGAAGCRRVGTLSAGFWDPVAVSFSAC